MSLECTACGEKISSDSGAAAHAKYPGVFHSKCMDKILSAAKVVPIVSSPMIESIKEKESVTFPVFVDELQTPSISIKIRSDVEPHRLALTPRDYDFRFRDSKGADIYLSGIHKIVVTFEIDQCPVAVVTRTP